MHNTSANKNNLEQVLSVIPSSPKHYPPSLGAQRLKNNCFKLNRKYSLQKLIYMAAHSEDIDIPKDKRNRADLLVRKFLAQRLDLVESNILNVVSVDEVTIGNCCYVNGITYDYINPKTKDIDKVSLKFKGEDAIHLSRENHGVYDLDLYISAFKVYKSENSLLRHLRSMNELFSLQKTACV